MTAMEPRTRPVEVDFDHRDEESRSNPWGRWERLRAQGEITHSTNYGGFYIASRYEDLVEIARDAATFSSHPQVTIPPLPSPPMPPINFDPPVNRTYRMIVNPFFSPAKVRDYAPWIAPIADRYTSRMRSAKTIDFTTELAIPITREVILRIMGITEAPESVNQASDDLIMQNENAAAAGEELMGFLGGELAQRRAEPGADLISGLAVGKFEDRLLDDGEILATSLLVLLAGLETTASAMSGAVWYLVRHPAVLDKLRGADDATWRLAMDEFVRWVSPATGNSRNVMKDTEVNGCPMHGGDKVLMIWASANRDESEFPNADEIVPDRHPNRHVGFGMGPHRCLGSHLAKQVMQDVFTRIVDDLGKWTLADPAAVKWEGAEVRGIRSLRRGEVGGCGGSRHPEPPARPVLTGPARPITTTRQQEGLP